MFTARALTLLLWLVAGASSPSLAHEVRPAILNLNELGAKTWSVMFKQPQVQGRFLNLTVLTNCDVRNSQELVGVSALQYTQMLDCQKAPLDQVRIGGLERTMIDTIVTVTNTNGEISNFLITATNPTLKLRGPAPAVPVYLFLGMEHMALGVDHVLFVLVLIYLVSGFKNLLVVITSFTLAHCLTLVLSVFNLVTLPQPPVEALIALSIVLLARESLVVADSWLKRSPWLIAFLFGLLHGLGFASALSKIGLPEGNQVFALLLFNLGIEISQIFIVALALALTFLVRSFNLKIPAVVASLPLYAIGGVACYWVVERSLGIIS